jgi:hypothetical protein
MFNTPYLFTTIIIVMIVSMVGVIMQKRNWQTLRCLY